MVESIDGRDPSEVDDPPDRRESPVVLDPLVEAGAVVALGQLVATYADVVSRRAWDELEPLFAPAAPITLDLHRDEPIHLTGAAALGAFVASAVERFDFFAFTVLNHRVDVVDEDHARGRLYLAEVRREAADRGWSTAYGLYRDDYARHEGRWRFAARHYGSLGRRSGDVGGEVFPIP